jgi:hypothetical protein
VKGVGKVTVSTFITEWPELSELNRGQISKLVSVVERRQIRRPRPVCFGLRVFQSGSPIGSLTYAVSALLFDGFHACLLIRGGLVWHGWPSLREREDGPTLCCSRIWSELVLKGLQVNFRNDGIHPTNFARNAFC